MHDEIIVDLVTVHIVSLIACGNVASMVSIHSNKDVKNAYRFWYLMQSHTPVAFYI